MGVSISVEYEKANLSKIRIENAVSMSLTPIQIVATSFSAQDGVEKTRGSGKDSLRILAFEGAK